MVSLMTGQVVDKSGCDQLVGGNVTEGTTLSPGVTPSPIYSVISLATGTFYCQ